MKYLLLTLSLFCYSVSFAQQKPDFLEAKANQFAWKDKNYDSALHYYQVLNKTYPKYRSATIIFRIAVCCKNAGNVIEAEKNFLKCLSICELRGFSDMEVPDAFYALYEIYLGNKDYGKALLYLDYTKTKYKPVLKYKPVMRNCTFGSGVYFTMKFVYEKALCYDGLCLPDSVVATLAPHVFKTTSGFLGLDSKDYIQTSSLFVKSAVEIYGKSSVANLLANAIEKSFYTVEYKKDYRSDFFAYVKFGFEFLGTTVQFNTGGYGVKAEGEVHDFMKKDYFLSQVKQSPVYKMIMDKNPLFYYQ